MISLQQCLHRYSSRCILLKFSPPAIGSNLAREELDMFADLSTRMNHTSSSVGIIIQLGHDLLATGHEQIKENYTPTVKKS